MKAFLTLFWLEGRKLGVWVVGLLATLPLWFWLYRSLALYTNTPDRSEVQFVTLLLGLGFGGIGILLLTLLGWRDAAGTRLPLYLSAPTPRSLILLPRALFVFLSVTLYSLGLLWLWGYGVRLSGHDLVFAELLSLWGYVLMVFYLPLVTYSVLLATLAAAYSLRNLGWLVLLVGLFAAGEALNLIVTTFDNLFYRLPTLALPTFFDEDGTRAMLPQEAMWLGLLLSGLLLALSSRVLSEVEA